MDISFYLGVGGLVILLVAYLLLTFDVIDEHKTSYQTANLLGSVALGYYAYVLGVWVFVVLEGLWALFALYEVITIVCGVKRKKRRKRL